MRRSEFYFASPPRTGTTWFRHAMYEVGFEMSRVAAHVPVPLDVPGFKVAVTRHPCDWLRSYFEAIYPGHVGVACVDVFCQKREFESFVDFVEYYLNNLPGKIGEMFEAYNATTYLRLEDMPLAFYEMAQGLGFENYRNAAKVHIRNQSKKDVTAWYPELWQSVLEAEKDYVDRFNYLELNRAIA